jgi:hypothetical protein
VVGPTFPVDRFLWWLMVINPTAPTLRPIILSCSLIRWQAIQVYYHLPSFPRAVFWMSVIGLAFLPHGSVLTAITVNQFVLAPSPLSLMNKVLFFPCSWTCVVILLNVKSSLMSRQNQ